MQQFVPMTDDLIERLPASAAALVPYQVDLPCFRWAVVGGPDGEGPVEDSTQRRLAARRSRPRSQTVR